MTIAPSSRAGRIARSGSSILLVDTKTNNPNHYIVRGIEQALREHPDVAVVDRASYANAAELALGRRYDLCLAVDGEHLSVELLSSLRSLIATMALWCFEDPYERALTTSCAHLFDVVFTNDVGSTSFYGAKGVHLPLAASPLFDCRPVHEKDADYEYDVSFVGSAWPNRVATLRKLLASLPDLRWKIVLQYNQYLPPAFLDLPESDYIGSVSHEDFVEIGNRSRINLSLHRAFSGDGRGAKALNPGPRVFELGLAGGFQLIDEQEMDIASFFLPGRQVETFSSIHQCIAKIGEALANPGRRIGMAAAAQSEVRNRHLYRHRIDLILKQLQAAPPRIEVSTRKARPTLLMVTHNIISTGGFGGVEVYQDLLAQELRDRFNILYYLPDSAGSDGRQFVVRDARHRIVSRHPTPEFDAGRLLTDAHAEQAFASVLYENKVDLVHFQHLINHVPSLPLIAQMMGVPTFYTSHDFYLVCRRFNLVDHRNTYCAIVGKPVDVCDNCLHIAEDIQRGSQNYRRAFMSRVLMSMNRIIVNSPSAKAMLAGVYPELEQGDRFIALGIPMPTPRTSVRFRHSDAVEGTSRRTPPLKVVFMGNFSLNKGADSLLHAADALRDDNVHITLCGRIDEPYPGIIAGMGLPNITVMGSYRPGELDLGEYDVSLHLSRWPETYCISLSEAWRAGLVPVVTKVGALADRVADGINGYTLPIDGTGELIALLRRLSCNRQELERITANFDESLWITAGQHAARLAELYFSVLPDHRRWTPGVGTVLPHTTPSLAYAERPLNSPFWTEPKTLIGPPMPDPETVRLSPLGKVGREISEELKNGAVDFARTDMFGDLVISLTASGLIAEVGVLHAGTGSSVAITGNCRGLCGRDKVALLCRSLAGEVLLRDVHFDSDGGFSVAPISVDILPVGVSSLEMVDLGGRHPKILGVLATAIGNDGPGPRALFDLDRERRLPLAVDPWHEVGRRLSTKMVGRVDHLSVGETGAHSLLASDENVSMFWHLDIAGWLAEADDTGTIRGMMLRLRHANETIYHAPLLQESRSDMLPKGRTQRDPMIGYKASIWLHGMRPGRYTLSIMQRGDLGVLEHPLEDHVLHFGRDQSRMGELVSDLAGSLGGFMAREDANVGQVSAL